MGTPYRDIDLPISKVEELGQLQYIDGPTLLGRKYGSHLRDFSICEHEY